MKVSVTKTLESTSLFLRWWSAQLRACVDDLVNAVSAGRRRLLTAYWDSSRLVITDEKEPRAKVLLDIASRALPETRPEELKQALERGNRVRLFVSSEQAFVSQVQLPLAVLPHLDSAIALQFSKRLPLESVELLIDFAVAAKDEDRNTVDIDLVALKKADLNPLLERFRAWGLRIVSTHLGDVSAASQRFTFSSTGAPHHGTKLQKTDRLLVGVAATLGLACASVAATETYRSHASLQEAKTVTRVPAAAALTHRQDLLARLEPLRALGALEAAPSASALLAEVTMLVPQNTYLTTLEIQHGHARIVGVSPNSGAVLKFLSGSKLLNEVALRSSMSVGIGTGLDRFEVTAELKGAP